VLQVSVPFVVRYLTKSVDVPGYWLEPHDGDDEDDMNENEEGDDDDDDDKEEESKYLSDW
jgi:hypothetical protein